MEGSALVPFVMVGGTDNRYFRRAGSVGYGFGLFSTENGPEVKDIRSGEQVLSFVTDTKPSHAGVDPYNFYIDRNSADNVLPVK